MNVYKTPPKNYRTICAGDPDFAFADGVKLISRAAIEVSDRCPDYLKSAIRRAFNEGHIKLVANIPEREYMWEKLQS